MSIWLWIALFAYLLGVALQWFGFWQEFKELEECTDFPIVWAATVVTNVGCFIGALIWPYSLILDNELILENEKHEKAH